MQVAQNMAYQRGERRGGGQRRGGGERRPFEHREMHEITCADCGNKDKVPFKPDESRGPVYCQECYRKHRPPRRQESGY